MTDPVYVVTVCRCDPEVEECEVFEDLNKAIDWAAERALGGIDHGDHAAHVWKQARQCLAEDYSYSFSNAAREVCVQIHYRDVRS